MIRDVTERLRDRAFSSKIPDPLLEEAADEIERLRNARPAESSRQDIVGRLRRWTHAARAAPASDLMDEAAREIEMLRTALARIADQDATFSVIGGNIMVDIDTKLTDAEREALIVASIELNALACAETNHSAALRGLLERLQ